MLERVEAVITRHGLFAPGQRVGVAVSGGADSVCLLDVLRELAARWRLTLHVLHLDHGWRGEESRGDAEFVRQMAARFELPFTLETLPPAACTGNREQQARRARLRFFRAQIESGRLDRVATGHTRNDQAETVLFRLLRGAGGAGLAGIRPLVEPGIVRPLLDVTREDVETWLRSRGLAWREDSTNASLDFARNRLRHALLPQLAREWNPALSGTLAHTADWALEEERYWAREIALLETVHLRRDGSGGVLVPAACLCELPVAVARRLVLRAIECAKGDARGVGFAHIEAVRALARSARGSGAVQVPGLQVLRSFDEIRLGASPSAVWKPAAPSVWACGDLGISLDIVENPKESFLSPSVYNKGEEVDGLDAGLLSGACRLRNWQPGDAYCPRGATHRVKLTSLFQRERIPLWERVCWPVLVDGDAIVWSRRFGPAAELAAGPGTKRLLRVLVAPVDTEMAGVGSGASGV